MQNETTERKRYKPFANDISDAKFGKYLIRILAADKKIFFVAITYGIIIGLLTLSAPVSVQLLINSLSFTGIFEPILVLGIILLILVSLYGLMNILQLVIAETFQRRFFSRMSGEIGMLLLNADHQSFEKANQVELVNRFLETTTIQKTMTILLSKSFVILFQSIAGLLLIAFYHPFFLMFTFLIPLSVIYIWKSFAPKAVLHAFGESRKKYDLVSFLEDVANNQIIFKSQHGRDYAKEKINLLTGNYLEERALHFRKLFSQVSLFYILYAFATTLLLILGGWLVLRGQLTIGQLVASELVISAILFNISNLGQDFENFYQIIASSEKLSQFHNIPAESQKGKLKLDKFEEMRFDNVTCHYLRNEFKFNFKFCNNKNYLVLTHGYSTKKIIIETMLGFMPIISGEFSINKTDIKKYDKYQLRSHIAVIDNSPLLEGTLREYLTFNNPNISDNYILKILEDFELTDLILASQKGLDLMVIPSGWPFSGGEKIILKIVRALIQKPQIIIATEALDMLAPETRVKALEYLTSQEQASFIYFANRDDDKKAFDETLFIDKTSSRKK